MLRTDKIGSKFRFFNFWKKSEQNGLRFCFVFTDQYTCDGSGGGRKVIKICLFRWRENHRINMVFGNCRGKTIEMGWWSWRINVCSWRFSPDFLPEIKKKATISLALAYHSSNFGNFLSINAVKHPHSWDSLISPACDRTCFILTDLGASHIVVSKYKYNSPWLVFWLKDKS